MTERPTLHVTHRRSSSFVDDLGTELADRLDHDPLEHASTPAETRRAFETAAAVLTVPLRDEWLQGADDLEWIQTASAGVDHLPLDDLEERDVAVTNASGIHAQPIAEQVLGYMLVFERNLHVGLRRQEENVWEAYGGGELRGQTIGVVGLGAIGSRVAELASAVGMTVIGTKRDPGDPGDAPAAADEVYPPDGLHDVLARVDYLVVACPLTPETEGLIGEPELELLDRDAVLVNVARGEIVDQEALTGALQRHHVGGAALDVFEVEPLPADSPLWDLSNVLVTPHMAGSNPHQIERLAAIVAENYEAFAAGDRDAMRNRVV